MELGSAGHENSSAKLEVSAGSSARGTTDDEQDDLPYDGILDCYLIPNTDHRKLSSSDLKHHSIGNVCIEQLAAGYTLSNSINLENSEGIIPNDGTDDEQEELPYDGILECYLIPNTGHHEFSKSAEHSGSQQIITNLKDIEETSDPTDCEANKHQTSFLAEETDVFSFSESTSKYWNNENTEQVKTDTTQSKFRQTIIPEVLQRHFSDDGMLNSCKFIDSETIPEISIAESSEDIFSIRTWKKFTLCDSENEQEDELENDILGTVVTVNQEANVTSERNSFVDDAFAVNREEISPRLTEECNIQNDLTPSGNDGKSQNHKYDVERRSSYSDIKYGQGQVHYKLPDFSKVKPKVKIPKGNGHIKTFPSIKRTRSSPNLTESSNVIREILDSMQLYTEPEHVKEPCQTSGVLQSQVLVDTNVPLTDAEWSFIKSPYPLKIQETHTDALSQEADLRGNNLRLEQSLVSRNYVPAQIATEGEKMSAMLNEQALKLKIKVESFSDCLIKNSLPVKELHLLFQNLKSCLESLELHYLSTKEKHRDLQLQVYRTDSQDVGEFDTERQVEGQIFKLGMLLEDIQEQINERGRSQSPLISSEVSQHDTVSTPYTKIPGLEDVSVLPVVHSKDHRMVETSLKEETLHFRMELKSPMVMTASEMESYKQDTLYQEGTTDYADVESSHPNPERYYRPRLLDASLQMLEPEFNSQVVTPSSSHLSEKNTDSAWSRIDHNVEDTDFVHVNEPVLSDHFLFKKTITEWHLTENTREISHQKQRRSRQENEQSSLPLNSSYETFRAEKTENKLSNTKKLPFLMQEKVVNFPDCNETKDAFHSIMSSLSKISEKRSQCPTIQHYSLPKWQDYTPKKNKYNQPEDYSNSSRSYILRQHSFATSSSKPSLEINSKRSFSSGFPGFHSVLGDPISSAKGLFHHKSSSASTIPVYADNKGKIASKFDISKYRSITRYPSTNSFNRHFQDPFQSCSSFAGPVIPCCHGLFQERKCWSYERKKMDYMDNKILNSVLDQALWTARRMQRTTERMLKKLSADPAITSSSRLSYGH